jgi:hypothetical protein
MFRLIVLGLIWLVLFTFFVAKAKNFDLVKCHQFASNLYLITDSTQSTALGRRCLQDIERKIEEEKRLLKNELSLGMPFQQEETENLKILAEKLQMVQSRMLERREVLWGYESEFYLDKSIESVIVLYRLKTSRSQLNARFSLGLLYFKDGQNRDDARASWGGLIHARLHSQIEFTLELMGVSGLGNSHRWVDLRSKDLSVLELGDFYGTIHNIGILSLWAGRFPDQEVNGLTLPHLPFWGALAKLKLWKSQNVESTFYIRNDLYTLYLPWKQKTASLRRAVYGGTLNLGSQLSENPSTSLKLGVMAQSWKGDQSELMAWGRPEKEQTERLNLLQRDPSSTLAYRFGQLQLQLVHPFHELRVQQETILGKNWERPKTGSILHSSIDLKNEFGMYFGGQYYQVGCESLPPMMLPQHLALGVRGFTSMLGFEFKIYEFIKIKTSILNNLLRRSFVQQGCPDDTRRLSRYSTTKLMKLELEFNGIFYSVPTQ